MRIFFIRHGETTGDVEDRYGGDYDDHLSEKGIQQSQALAVTLKDKDIEVIYCSPLMRARETAKILTDTGGGMCIVRPELRERNQYGILTGMVKAEALRTHPDLAAQLADRHNTIEGAESYEAFSARIRKEFEAITELLEFSSGGNAAFVWHGGPMRVLFRDILNQGEIQELGDCSFAELEKEDGIWVLRSSERIVF